jgi:large subunit ribosomal protein L10
VVAEHHFWRLTVGLNLNDKKAVVAEISAKVASAQTIVVAEYRGIQVSHLTQLRAKARAEGVYLRVLKNTLARRAVEGTAFSSLASEMTGPLIYSISEDAVAAAKVMQDFAKGNDKLVIKAGNYAGKSLDKAGVSALASIPSREILLAQLLGIMQAPVSGFARALAALAAKKSEGTEAAAPAEASPEEPAAA